MAALVLVFRELQEWALAYNASDFTFNHVREVLEHLQGVYNIFKNCGMVLTEDEVNGAHEAIIGTGVHHQALTHFFTSQRRKLFYCTVKAHYVQHIGLHCLTRLNPRWSWTYCDEDFVGRVAGVAQACIKSRGR